MRDKMLYFVFDVEATDLYGSPFAFGFVVMDSTFATIEEGYACFDPGPCSEWVEANVIPHCHYTCTTAEGMYNKFWHYWMHWKERGATMWADCCYPVEAKFLMECIGNNPALQNDGPYPLFDISTLLLAKGYDPTGNYGRLENELPQHNPLKDARQSARILRSLMLGEKMDDGTTDWTPLDAAGGPGGLGL